LSENVEIKREIRAFYDAVGWQDIGAGFYQNARYEDLRPVAAEYIHRCHLRVRRHLPASGRFLLDAGSGPIQYPEYLEFSRNYEHRVCLDISILALQQARKRIGEHGLFVLADIANLPFKKGAMDGVVSLHAVHHIPGDEQKRTFEELFRMLKPGGSAVIVHSWGNLAPVDRLLQRPMRFAERVSGYLRRRKNKETIEAAVAIADLTDDGKQLVRKPGLHTFRHDYRWVLSELAALPGLDVRVWRSASPRITRAFMHPKLLGKLLLGILYLLEEMAPRLFGRFGQYPMIIFRQPLTEQ